MNSIVTVISALDVPQRGSKAESSLQYYQMYSDDAMIARHGKRPRIAVPHSPVCHHGMSSQIRESDRSCLIFRAMAMASSDGKSIGDDAMQICRYENGSTSDTSSRQRGVSTYMYSRIDREATCIAAEPSSTASNSSPFAMASKYVAPREHHRQVREVPYSILDARYDSFARHQVDSEPAGAKISS